MDLHPNADEEQIIDSAAIYLREEWPLSRLHRPGSSSFGESARRSFAELGWFGIGLPVSLGGAGFTAIEEALFYREIGRVLGPTDVLPIALALHLCARQHDEAAAGLLAGNSSVAFAVSGTAQVGSTVAGTFRLMDCETADRAIVIAGGKALYIELPVSAVTRKPSLDKSVSLGTVVIDSANIIASVPVTEITIRGRLMVSAMLIGICEAVTAMIVDYAKIRETFGRPIGAYQAVRHPCADMAVRTEAARAQLFYAAVAVRDGRGDAALQVNAAKTLANEAALLNVDANIQLHGGIGTTDEHDAHLYMKRTHVLSRWFGGDKALAAELLNERIVH